MTVEVRSPLCFAWRRFVSFLSRRRLEMRGAASTRFLLALRITGPHAVSPDCTRHGARCRVVFACRPYRVSRGRFSAHGVCVFVRSRSDRVSEQARAPRHPREELQPDIVFFLIVGYSFPPRLFFAFLGLFRFGALSFN